MEWNPVLEDRLKRSKQTAGWRWIGYVLVAFGTLGLIWGLVAAASLSVLGLQGWWALAPGALFLICGLFTALPAEKAAKEARELKIQKTASQVAQSRPAASISTSGGTAGFCGKCGTRATPGHAFCASCGAVLVSPAAPTVPS